MLPTKFRFIWPSGFRGEDFLEINQKQELSVAAMFVNGSGRNEHALFPHHRLFSVFSSPCQRQCGLLPSLGIRYPLTFHILIISSETPQPSSFGKAVSEEKIF
jgi:hypothetical protein